jgi:class 3 adenylate cyclase/CHASE2 domain-containing sensor protein
MLRLLVKPRRPRLLLGTLAIAVALAVATGALVQTPMGERLELRTVDARFAERGTLDPPGDVVVVAIDRTQDSFGSAWPLSRQTWASAISRLDEAGVAAIAIDVPMDWNARNPIEDSEFLEAVRESEVPVVLAAGAVDRVDAPAAGIFDGLDREARADAGLELEARLPQGTSARVRAADGVVRTYPVRAAEGGPEAAGIAAAVVRAAGAPEAVEAAPDELLLNWYGPRNTFEHISFANIAYGIDTFRELDGKVVVIGPTEGLGRDDHAVPMGSEMSSAEIQATAVANLLDGSSLRAADSWVGPAAIAAIAIAVWALLLVLPLGLAVPSSLAIVAGWGVLSVQLFDRGLVVPMLAPMLAGLLVFGATSVLLASLAVRERVRVKGLFARYVHADVVRELIDGEDRIELAGEEREITVLFSDIRGFTTMSEHVDPVEMVAQLNEYFEAMVEVVAAHDGTVDKFLGDGLMAIFGAPARREDHAERACLAALDMLDRLAEVNRGRVARGLDELRIGIGIHTGNAVVGNVGSPPFRVDFTAIGDTVNLAARIESMTKELGAVVVASESTRAAIEGAELGFEPLGSVVARGRSAATGVYAVRASAGRSATERVERAA